MKKKYIVYNESAGHGECTEQAELLKSSLHNAELTEIRNITDYPAFFSQMDETDDVILCGGDGTLNHFVNDIHGIEVKNNIYYYAVGSGNDFARDLGKEKGSNPTYKINEYLHHLPTVTVNGQKRLFLNGIGFGIDGYCCKVGDQLREQYRTQERKKPINYTIIAIKGLLFHYKPTDATITVDGEQYHYKKVWLAPQ